MEATAKSNRVLRRLAGAGKKKNLAQSSFQMDLVWLCPTGVESKTSTSPEPLRPEAARVVYRGANFLCPLIPWGDLMSAWTRGVWVVVPHLLGVSVVPAYDVQKVLIDELFASAQINEYILYTTMAIAFYGAPLAVVGSSIRLRPDELSEFKERRQLWRQREAELFSRRLSIYRGRAFMSKVKQYLNVYAFSIDKAHFCTSSDAYRRSQRPSEHSPSASGIFE